MFVGPIYNRIEISIMIRVERKQGQKIIKKVRKFFLY